MDYQGLPQVDLLLAGRHRCDRGGVVRGAATGGGTHGGETLARHDLPARPDQCAADGAGVAPGARPRRASLLHVSLSWNAAAWPFREPLDYIGGDGGAGIGAGPGVSVGAALALRGSGRLPVAVCGDGDFLMGVTALWTAVHYGIPLLVVVANNRSFFNDELHQERVARARNRPVENRWIGQRIGDPEIDLARMAEAQGAMGFGPVQ